MKTVFQIVLWVAISIPVLLSKAHSSSPDRLIYPMPKGIAITISTKVNLEISRKEKDQIQVIVENVIFKQIEEKIRSLEPKILVKKQHFKWEDNDIQRHEILHNSFRVTICCNNNKLVVVALTSAYRREKRNQSIVGNFSTFSQHYFSRQYPKAFLVERDFSKSNLKLRSNVEILLKEILFNGIVYSRILTNQE